VYSYCLPAQDVLELGSLPRLSFLLAVSYEAKEDETPEVEEAYRRMRQQLFSRGAAGSGGRDARRQIGMRTDLEGRPYALPLDPHQQQEMRQRVLEAAKTSRWKDGQEAVFFAELHSLLTTTATTTQAE
jgi:hypothetical protein